MVRVPVRKSDGTGILSGGPARPHVLRELAGIDGNAPAHPDWRRRPPHGPVAVAAPRRLLSGAGVPERRRWRRGSEFSPRTQDPYAAPPVAWAVSMSLSGRHRASMRACGYGCLLSQGRRRERAALTCAERLQFHVSNSACARLRDLAACFARGLPATSAF
jgi:hypothetical protein